MVQSVVVRILVEVEVEVRILVEVDVRMVWSVDLPVEADVCKEKKMKMM